jgi:hypothetical protein
MQLLPAMFIKLKKIPALIAGLAKAVVKVMQFMTNSFQFS